MYIALACAPCNAYQLVRVFAVNYDALSRVDNLLLINFPRCVNIYMYIRNGQVGWGRSVSWCVLCSFHKHEGEKCTTEKAGLSLMSNIALVWRVKLSTIKSKTLRSKRSLDYSETITSNFVLQICVFSLKLSNNEIPCPMMIGKILKMIEGPIRRKKIDIFFKISPFLSIISHRTKFLSSNSCKQFFLKKRGGRKGRLEMIVMSFTRLNE